MAFGIMAKIHWRRPYICNRNQLLACAERFLRLVHSIQTDTVLILEYKRTRTNVRIQPDNDVTPN